MEPFTQLFQLVGLDITTCLWVSGTVYVLVEAVKAKFPTIERAATQAFAGIFAISIAVLVAGSNIPGVIVLALVAWLAPDGIHQIRFGAEKRAERAKERARLKAVARGEAQIKADTIKYHRPRGNHQMTEKP